MASEACPFPDCTRTATWAAVPFGYRNRLIDNSRAVLADRRRRVAVSKGHGLMRTKLENSRFEFSVTCEHRTNSPLIHTDVVHALLASESPLRRTSSLDAPDGQHRLAVLPALPLGSQARSWGFLRIFRKFVHQPTHCGP